LVGEAGKVVGIDVVRAIVELAKENLVNDGFRVNDGPGSILLEWRDGWKGWKEHGLYDAIHVGASSSTIPADLVEQLAPGGLMTIPVGDRNKQHLTLVTKSSVDSSFTSVKLTSETVRFVPLVDTSFVDYDKRYKKGWAYGKNPNDFLVKCANDSNLGLTGSTSALSLGEGQGRNIVYLATSLSCDVCLAIDSSSVGLDKTNTLASHKGASAKVQTLQLDLKEPLPSLNPSSFDLVISFFLALPSSNRRALHKNVANLLNDGGLYILECFSPTQGEINKKSGTRNGPMDSDLLVSAQDLIQDFDGEEVEVLIAEEQVRELFEGSFHRVKEAAVTRFVCKKKGKTTAWTGFGEYMENMGSKMKGGGINADFEAMLEAALATEQASTPQATTSPPQEAPPPPPPVANQPCIFKSWADAIFNDDLKPSKTSNGALPTTTDAYLNSSSEILNISLQHAREKHTCPYCWFCECQCKRLAIATTIATPTNAAYDFKVNVVLLVHPIEFLRSSSTCKLLRGLMANVKFEYLLLGVEGTGERLTEIAKASNDSTYILYPSEDSATTDDVIKRAHAPASDAHKSPPKAITIIVPDGSWKMTEKILSETNLLNIRAKTLKIDDSIVGDHISPIIEALNTSSGTGRLSTAEAVAFCLKGLGFAEDAKHIFDNVERLGAIFEERKLIAGAIPCYEIVGDDEVLINLHEVASKSKREEIPLGLRWCAVCGAAMGSTKRMYAHLCGKRHLQCVLAASRGEWDNNLTPVEIFVKHSKEKLKEGLKWIDAPDVAVATLFEK